MNNFSMLSADRMTHLKVVAMALVCATLVAGIGVAARVTDGATGDPRRRAAHAVHLDLRRETERATDHRVPHLVD